MSLNPNSVQATSRPLPAAGLLAARNYMIIDLGIQSESYNNQPPTKAPKVTFIWELGTQLHQFDEKKGKEPLTVMAEYSMTAGTKSKLPGVLKTWGSMANLPKKINVAPFLGQYCMLTIEHYIKKDNTQGHRIAGSGRQVAPFMKELPKPPAYNPNFLFDLDAFTWESFYKVPKFLQDKIRKCEQWAGIVARLPEPVNAQGQDGNGAGNSYQQPTNAIPETAAPIHMASQGDNEAPAF